MLQFVIGSAGAGKSSRVFRQIIDEAQQNPEKTYLVIVPEQFTLQTQKVKCGFGHHLAQCTKIFIFKQSARLGGGVNALAQNGKRFDFAVG